MTSQYYELKTYLEIDFSINDSKHKEFNILQWWKMRQSRFPVFSQLVCDILIVLVSAVSLESTFSVVRRVVELQKTFADK